MTLLGIDIGTTRIKVVLYDERRAAVIAEAAAATPTAQSDAGEVHLPQAIVDTMTTLVDAATQGHSASVAAIAVASVGEEVVLLDDGGRPLDSVLTWYNLVGRDEAPGLMATLDGEVVWRSQPDPTFSLFKLAWLDRHRRSTLRRTAVLTDLGSYVTGVLAGHRAADVVMDWSHASRTGLFDVPARQWITAAAQAVGLGLHQLPRLVPSGTVVGELAPELATRWGMRPGVAICTGGHDHLCAAFACGIRQPGEIFLSAGTSEAQLILLDDITGLAPGSTVDVGCFVDERHFYVHQAIPSGQLFRQWRDLLYRDADDATLYREVAQVVAGTHGVRCLIDAVNWSLTMADVPTTAPRGVLMRALLEGLAVLAASVGAELAGLATTPVRRIVAAGNPTREPVWQRIRSAVSTIPMTFDAATEPSATGAALLAGRAVDPTQAQTYRS